MTAPDTLLAYWSEHREQLRQSESQRAVLTNYVLAIAAAISGLVVQQRFRAQTLPLSVLVVLIGLYGALAAAKYHERANYHLGQARALTRALVQSGDLPDNDVILLDQFRDEHAREYPQAVPDPAALAMDRPAPRRGGLRPGADHSHGDGAADEPASIGSG